MSLQTDWRVVWITGASTGIGRQLALDLARRGATVAISARSADKLAEVAALHANMKPYPLDVTDRAAGKATVASIERDLGPIDLAILNAGIWHLMGARDIDAGKVADAMAVNYMGNVYAIEALLPSMRARRAGHLALVASVAGFIGLPRSLAYGPTKAALINLAETLKPDLERDGITTSIVNPGFVDTPMTKQNPFPMPFILTVEEASGRILSGLKKRRFEISFPFPMWRLLRGAQKIPYSAFFWIIRNIVMRNDSRL